MSDSRLLLRAATFVTVGALSLTLAACNTDDAVPGAAGSDEPSSASPSEPVPALRLTTSIKKGAQDVPVDHAVSVSAQGGTIDAVKVSSSGATLAGELASDGSSWTATDRLEPGTSYTMTATAEKTDGSKVTRTANFHTQALTLDQQTYPSVAPLAGETVGVGMPVIVTFDVPVTDKAAFEKHMTVTSKPAQPGAWHWLSSTEAHWRPKSYWKADTDVHVDVDVNSVPAGNGIYGQESRELNFHVGDAHVYRVNMVSHQMKVFSNGKLLRTIPITTGQQPTYTTRSGTKVIIEKFASKDMNSETVGITGADAYNIEGVQWAMRLTYSGEFIHAAPWSVGSQGYANVSHGCTGMSTANAAWLYAMSRRGDVVEYTGSDKPMTLDNGYGDWNESFKQYEQGSALS
ncbi:L,D-transpeptidase [Nocardioides sp. URHA0032]|uniref:L,D-transpeptidase n=1 Tax=Nocardioides sp. URHA0032 TaxID=1380388 RepID=UPI00049051E9|nr:Ig-like domain-containing protein [Nocardioides sp. URHA0032]